MNHSPWKHFKSTPYKLLLLLSDLGLIFCVYSLAYLIRFFVDPMLVLVPVKTIPSFSIYLQVMPVVLLAWAFSMIMQNAYYRLQIPATDEFVRCLKISVVSALLSMSAMYLYRERSYSRLVFLMGGAGSCFALYFWRQTLKTIYLMWIRATKQPRRVLVVGTSGHLSNSLERLLKRLGDRAILKTDVATLDEIKKILVRSRIQEVLLAKAKLSPEDTVKLATYCEEKDIVVRLLPDILEIRMGEVVIDDSLGIPTFQLKPVSLHGSAFITKRFFDVAISSLLLGILFYPLTLVAMLIKFTSPGGVFFKQERIGFRGQPFKFIKFRTMVKNAEADLDKLKPYNERPGLFKMKKDPRITPVGRFLRRYSIDEIPQFLNVLRGEMSLVGPRPQIPHELVGSTDWARKRMNVLPGITGLWQVSGRAELTYDEMIDMDIYYIEHWSAGLDFKILLKTLPAILFGKGAY